VDALKIPFVIVPLVNNHSNQHSFDENIRVGHLLDGVRSFTGLLRARRLLRCTIGVRSGSEAAAPIAPDFFFR
jgi:hypothetical protein